MIGLSGVCKRGRDCLQRDSIYPSRSFPGLSPGVQRLGPLAIGRWHEQKFGDIHRQRSRQAVKQIDGWVEFQALDFAYRSAINLRFKGEGLLTDTLCGSNTSKIPSDAAASIHAGDANNVPLTNLSDIADIFDNCSVE